MQNVFAVHRFAQGAADWRSGPRWSILSALCLVHPLPLRGVPLKGKREVWRGKTASHIFHVPFRRFLPPLVVNAVSQSPECVSCHMTQKGKSRNADFISIAPKGETTHYILRVASAPSKCVRCAPQSGNPPPSAAEPLSPPERKRTQPFYTTRGEAAPPPFFICARRAPPHPSA